MNNISHFESKEHLIRVGYMKSCLRKNITILLIANHQVHISNYNNQPSYKMKKKKKNRLELKYANSRTKGGMYSCQIVWVAQWRSSSSLGFHLYSLDLTSKHQHYQHCNSSAAATCQLMMYETKVLRDKSQTNSHNSLLSSCWPSHHPL